jgi:hypothetical protein
MYAMLNLYRPFKTLNEIPHVIDFIFGHFFRDKLITLWQKEMCERKIPYSQDLNLISMLVDTTTVRYILLHGIFCFACDYGNSFSFTLLPCACPHHNLYQFRMDAQMTPISIVPFDEASGDKKNMLNLKNNQSNKLTTI